MEDQNRINMVDPHYHEFSLVWLNAALQDITTSANVAICIFNATVL